MSTSQGKASYDRVDEVDALGRRPARNDDGARRKARSRDDVLPDPPYEAPRLRGAVVVQRDDDDPRVPPARVDVRAALAVRDDLHLRIGGERVDEPDDRGAVPGPTRAPPGEPVSTTIWVGATTPAPEPVAQQLEAANRLGPAGDRRDRARA